MTDKVWKRNEPDSPCQNICIVHQDSKLCIGCNRTMDEIRDWARMAPQLRSAIIAELPARDLKLRRVRKGRRARLTEPHARQIDSGDTGDSSR